MKVALRSRILRAVPRTTSTCRYDPIRFYKVFKIFDKKAFCFILEFSSRNLGGPSSRRVLLSGPTRITSLPVITRVASASPLCARNTLQVCTTLPVWKKKNSFADCTLIGSGGNLSDARVEWNVTAKLSFYQPPNWSSFTFYRYLRILKSVPFLCFFFFFLWMFFADPTRHSGYSYYDSYDFTPDDESLGDSSVGIPPISPSSSEFFFFCNRHSQCAQCVAKCRLSGTMNSDGEHEVKIAYSVRLLLILPLSASICEPLLCVVYEIVHPSVTCHRGWSIHLPLFLFKQPPESLISFTIFISLSLSFDFLSLRFSIA